MWLNADLMADAIAGKGTSSSHLRELPFFCMYEMAGVILGRKITDDNHTAVFLR